MYSLIVAYHLTADFSQDSIPPGPSPPKNLKIHPFKIIQITLNSIHFSTPGHTVLNSCISGPLDSFSSELYI